MKKQKRIEGAEPAPTPNAPRDLDDLVRAVASGRLRANAILEQIAAARQLFDESIRPLVEQKDALVAELVGDEEALRSATLAAYAESGSKRPHPATGVRVQTRLIYDREALTAYARQHLTQVLVLDVKAFERVAATLHVPGVEVVEEPQATIAQDLARYLPPALESAWAAPASPTEPEPGEEGDPLAPAA
ncbi:MAG TPA: hypothetical protein VKY74_26335 [Chloroflexia bacterium]|nr:hypothetical protein [Chloroflexia bacterium]